MVKMWVLYVAAATSAAGQNDFRKAAWGMTPEQVRATESAASVEVSESNREVLVRYNPVWLGGLAGQPVYIFANGRLVRGKYLFAAEHSDLNDFIRDFKAIEPLLLERHGKPAIERAIWEDDSTQLEPKSYLDQDRASPASILASDPNVGLAVSLGHLRLVTQWEGPRTRVSHVLAGQDHHITHQVEYRRVEATPNDAKP